MQCDWEIYFLENLSLIERVIAFVCRKYGLTGADAEDFASASKIKLIEDGYAVLRKFAHKGSLSTYLAIVIQRHYLDLMIRHLGRWRPSLRARQGGEAAIFLERLISRDGLAIGEASTIVRQRFTDLDARALESLTASIVVKRPRRQSNGERTKAMREPASESSAEDELLSGEREVTARRAGAVLSRELGRLPPEDRLIMKLRFIDGMKVSTMAGALRTDQKQLYRRIERLVASLREAVLAARVAMSDIADMLAHGADTLHIDFGRVLDVSSRQPPQTRPHFHVDQHALAAFSFQPIGDGVARDAMHGNLLVANAAAVSAFRQSSGAVESH